MDNRPLKTQMRENWCNNYVGFIIMQFLNTARVPKTTHPTEDVLSSNTSPRRQIFRLLNHQMNDPTITTIALSSTTKAALSFSTTLHHSVGTGSPFPAHQHSVFPATDASASASRLSVSFL